MRILFVAALAAITLSRPAWADNANAIADSTQIPQDGAGIYNALCQGCHMPDGRGAVGAAQIPALAGNAKLASTTYPAYVVANGYGAMPWFADKLSDTQIAAVVNFIRTHFGNHFDGATQPADVAPVRPKTDATTSSFD